MQLKLEMSCHQLKVYTKFETDISKHVENKSWKLGRTDGRTDGRTEKRWPSYEKILSQMIKQCCTNQSDTDKCL